MRFNALFDQVIVQVEEDNDMKQSSGGVFIPNAEKTDIGYGTVVAHGKGTDKYKNRDGSKLEFGVKIGDKIGFKKIQSSDIEIFNKKYKIMEVGAIIGVFTDSNETDETSNLVEEEK